MQLPDIIEEIDYETLQSDTLEFLKGLTVLETEFLESDPVMLVVESLLYREMLLRARINESLRASYLLTATGGNLDVIAYGYGVERLADESDERLRERCLLSLSRFSTAGAEDTYIYWAKTVSAQIKEATVLNPGAGAVEIVYHSDEDHTDAILATCSSDDVRPLSDQVSVTKATVKSKELYLTVELMDGYDIITVRNNITEAFGSLPLGIGDDLTLAQILHTAHVDGVYKVTETSENGDRNANEREVIQPIIYFN